MGGFGGLCLALTWLSPTKSRSTKVIQNNYQHPVHPISGSPASSSVRPTTCRGHLPLGPRPRHLPPAPPPPRLTRADVWLSRQTLMLSSGQMEKASWEPLSRARALLRRTWGAGPRGGFALNAHPGLCLGCQSLAPSLHHPSEAPPLSLLLVSLSFSSLASLGSTRRNHAPPGSTLAPSLELRPFPSAPRVSHALFLLVSSLCLHLLLALTLPSPVSTSARAPPRAPCSAPSLQPAGGSSPPPRAGGRCP